VNITEHVLTVVGQRPVPRHQSVQCHGIRVSGATASDAASGAGQRPVPRHQSVLCPRVAPSEGAMAIFHVGLINSPLASLGWCSAPLGLSVHALGVLGESLTHLCLQKCESIASECDSSALHCEIALSDTRCSSCKLVVLVTLGGCHLLDGLVACGSIETCKKIVQDSSEAL
jgi:hypothetical protein